VHHVIALTHADIIISLNQFFIYLNFPLKTPIYASLVQWSTTSQNRLFRSRQKHVSTLGIEAFALSVLAAGDLPH
jgi:hypothetical protein